MEQHSVPRNITGFQFRLVGDMTLKQFGYLATGAILAYLFFRAPLPGILTFPLAAFIGFLGVAFAFLPIQERPLDQWLAAFLKSVYSPTQFIWRKEPPVPEVLKRPQFLSKPHLPSSHVSHFEESKKKLDNYLKTLPARPSETLDKEESQVLTQTLSLFYEAKTPPRERLGQELVSLRQKLEEKPKEIPSKVKIVPPSLAPKVGLISFSRAPNIVCGLVKDGEGNLLSGILVMVKDQAGLTLRALKTNRLGQFAASTALPNGTYTLEIEDPRKRFQFDIIEINLKGEIFLPLEILAKGERELLRERLTKDLFGNREF